MRMEMEGMNGNLKEEMGEASFEKAKSLILQAKEMADQKGIEISALVEACCSESDSPMHEMAEEESEDMGSSTGKEAKKTAIIIALKKKADAEGGY